MVEKVPEIIRKSLPLSMPRGLAAVRVELVAATSRARAVRGKGKASMVRGAERPEHDQRPTSMATDGGRVVAVDRFATESAGQAAGEDGGTDTDATARATGAPRRDTRDWACARCRRRAWKAIQATRQRPSNHPKGRSTTPTRNHTSGRRYHGRGPAGDSTRVTSPAPLAYGVTLVLLRFPPAVNALSLPSNPDARSEPARNPWT